MRALRVASVIMIVSGVAVLVAGDRLRIAGWAVFAGTMFVVIGVQRLLVPRAVIQRHVGVAVDFLDPIRETRVGPGWVRFAGVFWLSFGLTLLAFGIAIW